MEIIVLPYMVISFSIAWAIFSPFAAMEDLHDWTFARIETSDLFALFVPISFLLATVKWAIPDNKLSTPIFGSIVTGILLLAIFSFVAGLFLFPKIQGILPAKRMAMIGIIIPFGTLLSVGWIALPLFAWVGSTFYAIPAMAAVVPITLILRCMSRWVCGQATA